MILSLGNFAQRRLRIGDEMEILNFMEAFFKLREKCEYEQIQKNFE